MFKTIIETIDRPEENLFVLAGTKVRILGGDDFGNVMVETEDGLNHFNVSTDLLE